MEIPLYLKSSRNWSAVHIVQKVILPLDYGILQIGIRIIIRGFREKNLFAERLFVGAQAHIVIKQVGVVIQTFVKKSTSALSSLSAVLSSIDRTMYLVINPEAMPAAMQNTRRNRMLSLSLFFDFVSNSPPHL
jgi:hypothetical protein